MGRLSHKSIMSFGIHRGKLMEEVPADYLLFIFNNSCCTAEVAWYINRNLKKLESIAEKKSKK